ncbi:hypothetical protein [Parabacteroides merdae]|jgi:hypothetical protein|uniref:Uncharacterized protein n=1 Tax=Parabacteroides merdae TaxID=46503 RepID=A0AA43W4H5_9BACT|nr:hypothetical protein [Parabacteroides merdae]MTT25759.1 hypothetical protein [Parabacteroides merdae]MTU53636.1 hypothetical protein [Parabacteroides merdae]MTU62094.1 hypothetical protein [Parabacteroides merdae]MTU65843.1 hypothetical protein [Parabacteroides merdae]MTU70178.1 hypothetical protein [Parabacteroides merdae]
MKVLIIAAQNFMFPMLPACASSAESEGDGQPPSDSERRRLARGMLKPIPRTFPVCSVTDAGQAAHSFIFPIFTGMNQNDMGLTVACVPEVRDGSGMRYL